MSAISGNADLTPDQNQHLYTVPAGKCATVTVNLCNRALTSCEVYIFIVKGTHTAASFIEFKTLLPPSDVLERTGLVMTAEEA